MKSHVLPKARVVTLFFVSTLIWCSQIPAVAESSQPSPTVIEFTVKTYDGLELPAQVIKAAGTPKKLFVFIMGPPCDEKGNMGPSWDVNCVSVAGPYGLYVRFLKTMPAKGYAVATIAKRNFVYPCNIPRPCLDDFARDIRSLIEEMMKRQLLADESDLILAGHSNASIIATKTLPLLKKRPAACVLLGSGSNAFDFEKQPWQDWYYVDYMRRVSGMSDEQIKNEFQLFKKIHAELPTIDEDTFENVWKKNGYPFEHFAPYESYRCIIEFGVYDPVPDLLKSNTPVLICIGQNDGAMPMVLAERTYKDLLEQGFNKATFKVIEGEVHSYKKYDVFAIMDAWIDSGYRSTEFVLDEQDKQIIASYEASVDRIARAINELPLQGAPERALECFRKARDADYQGADPWFKLGLVLFDSGHYEESLYSFKKATDPDFIVCFASMTWIGHINDLLNNRQEAISWYNKALAHDPGFPVQHDQWGITIDKKWIEDRLTTPFPRIKHADIKEKENTRR